MFHAQLASVASLENPFDAGAAADANTDADAWCGQTLSEFVQVLTHVCVGIVIHASSLPQNVSAFRENVNNDIRIVRMFDQQKHFFDQISRIHRIEQFVLRLHENSNVMLDQERAVPL